MTYNSISAIKFSNYSLYVFSSNGLIFSWTFLRFCFQWWEPPGKLKSFSNDFGKSKEWRRFANSWLSTCIFWTRGPTVTNAGAFRSRLMVKPLGTIQMRGRTSNYTKVIANIKKYQTTNTPLMGFVFFKTPTRWPGGRQLCSYELIKSTPHETVPMMWKSPTKPEVSGLFNILLVVWLPSILFSQKYWVSNHPNWLSYFSEGFKPPTRYCLIPGDGIFPIVAAKIPSKCPHKLWITFWALRFHRNCPTKRATRSRTWCWVWLHCSDSRRGGLQLKSGRIGRMSGVEQHIRIYIYIYVYAYV